MGERTSSASKRTCQQIANRFQPSRVYFSRVLRIPATQSKSTSKTRTWKAAATLQEESMPQSILTPKTDQEVWDMLTTPQIVSFSTQMRSSFVTVSTPIGITMHMYMMTMRLTFSIPPSQLATLLLVTWPANLSPLISCTVRSGLTETCPNTGKNVSVRIPLARGFQGTGTTPTTLLLNDAPTNGHLQGQRNPLIIPSALPPVLKSTLSLIEKETETATEMTSDKETETEIETQTVGAREREREIYPCLPRSPSPPPPPLPLLPPPLLLRLTIKVSPFYYLI